MQTCAAHIAIGQKAARVARDDWNHLSRGRWRGTVWLLLVIHRAAGPLTTLPASFKTISILPIVSSAPPAPPTQKSTYGKHSSNRSSRCCSSIVIIVTPKVSQEGIVGLVCQLLPFAASRVQSIQSLSDSPVYGLGTPRTWGRSGFAFDLVFDLLQRRRPKVPRRFLRVGLLWTWLRSHGANTILFPKAKPSHYSRASYNPVSGDGGFAFAVASNHFALSL